MLFSQSRFGDFACTNPDGFATSLGMGAVTIYREGVLGICAQGVVGTAPLMGPGRCQTGDGDGVGGRDV